MGVTFSQHREKVCSRSLIGFVVIITAINHYEISSSPVTLGMVLVSKTGRNRTNIVKSMIDISKLCLQTPLVLWIRHSHWDREGKFYISGVALIPP